MKVTNGMEGITGRLENWVLDTTSYSTPVVRGNLYEDANCRWREGERIRTSSVVTPAEAIFEGAIIHTLNSTYLLGTPLNADFTE